MGWPYTHWASAVTRWSKHNQTKHTKSSCLFVGYAAHRGVKCSELFASDGTRLWWVFLMQCCVCAHGNVVLVWIACVLKIGGILTLKLQPKKHFVLMLWCNIWQSGVPFTNIVKWDWGMKTLLQRLFHGECYYLFIHVTYIQHYWIYGMGGLLCSIPRAGCKYFMFLLFYHGI